MLQAEINFDASSELHGLPRSALALRDFVASGRATITIENTRTGGRYTFRVASPKTKTASGGYKVNHQATVRFVSVLTGPNNNQDYTFFGSQKLDGSCVLNISKRDQLRLAKAIRSWDWFWRRISADQDLPEFVNVYHSGRCARCGRKLTVPESLRTGLGPECAGRMK